MKGIELDNRRTALRSACFLGYKLNHFAMAIAGEVAPDVSSEEAYTFMQILDRFTTAQRVRRKWTSPRSDNFGNRGIIKPGRTPLC